MVALNQLADVLEDDSNEAHYELLAPVQTTQDLYEGYLTYLRIVKNNGALKIYRDGNILMISGSSKNTSIFATNLRFLHQEALSQPLMQSVLHIHIEYFPDHPYLDPVSDSVVIYVTAP